MTIKKIPLGKLLIEKKLITEEQLKIAINQQTGNSKKIGQVLIDLGFVQEDALLELLGEQLHIPYIDLKDQVLDPEVVRLLPEQLARHFQVIVLEKKEETIVVGMVDPKNVIAYDEIKRILKKQIKIALVAEKELKKIFDIVYRHSTEISDLAEKLSIEIGGKNAYDVAHLASGLSSDDVPVAKLLQTIFEDAIQVNASDVHIEPDETVLRIRHRVDGILHEQILKEKNVADALSLRLKLMAHMNIAEKRLPQDGRFSIRIGSSHFDVRVSTLPSQFGESVVMRLLNQSAELLNLNQIGMPDFILKRMRKIISLPNGLLLMTGPTGSGKTTTLYGILSELNKPDTKIITVEDPVEYRLPRIIQVQVQPKINLTFSTILRAALRQDPDIIMVGELRDQETAVIALRAAMTGHFVFSTLHTNDAVSSLVRLIDMGAEGYILATVLRGIIAQRLVRRICQNCVEEEKLTPAENAWLESITSYYKLDKIISKKGIGCAYCHQTGYKGQVGVFELLELTNNQFFDALRQNNRLELDRLVKSDKNFYSLVVSGLDLVKKSITTVREVIRITGDILIN